MSKNPFKTQSVAWIDFILPTIVKLDYVEQDTLFQQSYDKIRIMQFRAMNIHLIPKDEKNSLIDLDHAPFMSILLLDL